MNTIPTLLFADPKASYMAHKQEIDEAVLRVLEGGWYILGQEVTAFEKEFAAYIGVSNGIGVGSGTDAVHLALRACGIGPGDAVITVSQTAVATVAAIELTGATAVCLDIDPKSFTLDVKQLEPAILAHRKRLKAIVPVHLYGHPADMPSIMEIAVRYKLLVVEDCAQSHGAIVHGRRTGTWGQMAAFSFYPTKNLGALGDGGAIVTNDAHLAEQARLLRQYGWRTRYISEVAGLNSRLDEVQAAILRVKLRYLDTENRRRRQIAQHYNRLLAAAPDLRLPQCAGEVEHVYHQYVVRSSERDGLAATLKSQGIGTAVLYPEPVHLQPAYKERIATSESGLPVTERICREILCLPAHPHLSDGQVEQIAARILDFFERPHLTTQS